MTIDNDTAAGLGTLVMVLLLFVVLPYAGHFMASWRKPR